MQPSLKTRDLLALPPVDRPRPERATRISRKEVAGFLLTATWVLVVALVVVWLFHMVTTRPVPNVVGVEQSVAITRLAQLGYDSKVVAVRFGDEQPGTVLEQTPRGGARGDDNTRVELVIAAGTNAGTMPDLAGETQLYSELVLRQMGLSVMVVELVGDEPAGQVLSVKPAPGSAVAPGDSVTLTVSGYQETLAPAAFPIGGLRVVIEPQWADTGSVDASYEIAIRVASLIEAAGGRPTITREATEKQVSNAEFDRRRRAANPAVYVRIGFRDAGEGGVWILSTVAESGGDTPASIGEILADRLQAGAIAREFKGPDESLTGDSSSVGVILGSPDDSLDATHFADADWRDLVARAIYIAVGEWATR